MKFKNKQNQSHFIKDGHGDRWIWESRSCAVNGVIIIFLPNHTVPYVLASRRGPKSADFQGLMNLAAGYMDWNESGPEAMVRETWEEVGLNLTDFAYPHNDSDSLWYDVINNSLSNPWQVNTDPSVNRQNISLRYGLAVKLREPKFPDLSLDNNEVDGEVSEAWWMPVNEIHNHKWAFDHDLVIIDYLAKIGHLDDVFTT